MKLTLAASSSAAASSAAASSAETGNLPAESNAFIGRERDLADLASIMQRVRAVTLCGPGGIGKTRLAIRLGSTIAASFPGGVWLADQADAKSASQIVQIVATALRIRPENDRPLAETLTDSLRPRELLLILDTCEHLVAESAQLVEGLLATCPRLRIIATSREPLRTRGEVIWRVPPLGLPATGIMIDERQPSDLSGCEAVQLFAVRAAAVRPDFALSAANADVVAEICTTLDGVPLAIELAAARIRTLAAEQIKSRLASRFELLAMGDRTAPPRQQTLRAAVAWSYDQLTGPERELLSRLSVFRGWNLEMAEQVCADDAIPAAEVLELLTALIDKSLVSADLELGGAARYRLPDTVRQFTVDQVTDAAEFERIRRAHRDCMLALAEGLVSTALVPDEPSWQERVDSYHRALAEWANCQLALAYCAERGDTEHGLRLCSAMAVSWLLSGDHSGSGWLDRFLAASAPVPAGLRARCLVVRSEIAFEQQDYEAAARFAAEAAQAGRDLPASSDANLAGAQRMLAVTAMLGGRPQEALTLADAAIATAKAAGDAWDAGVTLSVKAALLMGQGDTAGARRLYREATEVLGEGRGWAVANVKYGLGRLACGGGDRDGAVRQFSAALAMYSQVAARPQMARCLAWLGRLAMEGGDLVAARASLTECMRLSLETGQRLAIARSLVALASLAAVSQDLPAAIRLAGTAQALAQAMGSPLPSAGRMRQLIESAQATLGPRAVAGLLAEGGRTSPHQAAQAMLTLPEQPGHKSWPGPLTEREQEVARLVADGLSNRAIGERLAISQATAARHIANIFVKLGFSARSQLIAWVLSGLSRSYMLRALST
ncbi:MAG TPA: LuxR C-terminal-related transcriptional regulator [Streptosporangiaceae bacterium]|nr:LuxR C-terminal-related transcriptional regulator [Streptosporangiaceae bacterium]